MISWVSIVETDFKLSRPWHDARAVTCANQEKGGLGGR